jgi:tol-pal system protein YbgF
MHIVSSLRHRLFAAAVFAVLLASTPVPAHATSKEIIELQTQVQQLLDMAQRLQSTLDTRFGVLQNLAQQTADNAAQMAATVNTLQQKLAAQSDASGGKVDTLSGQVQSLNDSVDELKSRISKLNKSVDDLQTQLQNIQNPSVLPAPSANGAASAPGTTLPSPSAGGSAAGQAPPLQETFQAGLRDYNAAKYDVASGEFQDVIHYYPLDDLAGQAQFYLGEISYRRQDYSTAEKAYSAVLEGFPGSPRAPAAQLRKGLSLIQMNKKEAGIHELRLLIQRHPQTPEATQARSKLNGLGVKITAAH